ncbi:EAL domain-containing protein, partial [Parabacteroides distasonis]|nr:EAL domain-containing protein [Parabacteroides distasonis]
LLLCQVAERLVNSVRQGDTVARLGGDEFVIIASDLSHEPTLAANQAERLAQKIVSNLTREYNLDGLTYNSSVSIGVTLFNSENLSKEDLLKQADMAMYKAKYAGRNDVQFFDPQMQVAVSSRAAIISDLYSAIQSQQFVLFYQKQVNHLKQCIGVEVLLRWIHPEKGMVSPLQFIPLAEETGLIVPIGEWVLEEACATLAKWSLESEKQHLSIAVNISVVQFSKDNFVQTVLNALKTSGANPQLLKLEITETLLANNIPDVKAKMKELQQHGVTFSIDDFGTGYSSLSYLKQLPINQLKIDQGFVRDIINSSNDRAIAQAVITLADSMELQVIAEGVETEAQRALLQSMGCHTYQGYL